MFNLDPSEPSFGKVHNLCHTPFWLDSDARPQPFASLELDGHASVDLLIIGGGFTGLWAAVEAALENPDQSIMLIEGDRIAGGATGRNGGFVAASLTHGFSNGLSRWASELSELERLGLENLNEIESRIHQFNIDCDWLRSGELDVAVEDYQLLELAEVHEQMTGCGSASELLGVRELRQRVDSPMYKGALFDPNVAMVDPARLAWGLSRVAFELGVVIHEHTKATDSVDQGTHVEVKTAGATIHAHRVLLATNAYPPLLTRLKHYLVPVYDYVIMTAPLTESERSSIGWSGREGIGDSGNQFHYYRMTQDGRILFGGYDANYHKGNGMGPEFDVDLTSFARLADHFAQIFPQLAEVKFTHGWGGAIDTCTRFSAFWGTAHGGKTAYVAGYTGLGVGASRFGALTCLDLLEGRDTERTRLDMVRTKPLPFPPEPLRSIGIGWTRRSLQKADREQGKRNLWLRTLDSMGLGFDS